jgi:hypothetical protein
LFGGFGEGVECIGYECGVAGGLGEGEDGKEDFRRECV